MGVSAHPRYGRAPMKIRGRLRDPIANGRDTGLQICEAERLNEGGRSFAAIVSYGELFLVSVEHVGA